MRRSILTTLATLRRVIQATTPALALGTATLTAALAACSDSPTGPSAAAAASARAPLVAGPVVRRQRELRPDPVPDRKRRHGAYHDTSHTCGA